VAVGEKAITAFQGIWGIFAAKAAAAGRNLPEMIAACLRGQRKRLIDSGASEDFDALVQAGCQPAMLALLLVALQYSPEAEWLRDGLLGPARRREQTIRSLRRTSALLDKMFPPELADAKAAAAWEREGQLTPFRVTHWLRELAEVLDFVDGLPRASVRSLEELVRFCLCAYVEDATGRPHNQQVAALVACALNRSPDEPAHAMWRKRNFARLEKALDWARAPLPAIAAVLQRNVT
jgi:hypothetical protein